MQTLGFFAWLREGVRRAVLLGFSDAVSQIGSRNEGEDLSPQLAATLQRGIAWEEARPAIAGPNPPGRPAGKIAARDSHTCAIAGNRGQPGTKWLTAQHCLIDTWETCSVVVATFLGNPCPHHRQSRRRSSRNLRKHAV